MVKRRCTSTGRFLTDTPEAKKPKNSTAAQPDSGSPSRSTNNLMAHAEAASSAITRAVPELAPHQGPVDRTTPQVTLAPDLADMEFSPPDTTPAPSESGESSLTDDILYIEGGLTMTSALHASIGAAIQKSFLVTDLGEEDEDELLYLRDRLVFNVQQRTSQVITADGGGTIYDAIFDAIYISQLREKKLSAMTEAVEPNVDPEEQIGAWSRVLAQQLTNLVTQSMAEDYRACKRGLYEVRTELDQHRAKIDRVSIRISSTLDRIMDGITKLKDALKDHMARHIAMDKDMDAKQAEAQAEVWIKELAADEMEEDIQWLDRILPFGEDA